MGKFRFRSHRRPLTELQLYHRAFVALIGFGTAIGITIGLVRDGFFG